MTQGGPLNECFPVKHAKISQYFLDQFITPELKNFYEVQLTT